MELRTSLPAPRLDALPLGAHRVSALTDEDLFRAAGVRIGFFGRAGGVSEGAFASLNTGNGVGDDPVCVTSNRARVMEALGAAGAPVVVASQVHGSDVVCVADACGVEAALRQAQAGADGVVVDVAGVAALLCFADCLPLMVVAPSGRFAVVHAGWRGAVSGIAGKAARELARAGEDPGGFNAYIGPHIRHECFEVGTDVAERFVERFGDDVVTGHGQVDLACAVAADLASAGLDPARIADCGICTKCHPDAYFSYRAAGGECGRHAAAAFRRP